MQAETLNCPMCGAATSTDDPQCQYCESRLATVACPSCFGMIFLGSKHCPRCGATAVITQSVDSTLHKCPRCRLEMNAVVIGTDKVEECERCLGLWVDVASFEKICVDREQQSAALGTASPSPGGLVHETSKVNYVPCPECSQLMNRINFVRCSGVIVDICKGHGTWFDRDELARIVEFIRGGGLEVSRAKQKAEIEEARRQLHQEQLASELRQSTILGIGDREDHRITSIASARGLLKLLLD